MPKTAAIELPGHAPIPILFEDRAILAIDKPAGWMLVPHTWQRTAWNLQAALQSSLAAGHFWARSRNLKFLRYIHRLDAETTGVMLFGKSFGAVETYGDLFEARRITKRYLAIVHGEPRTAEWTRTDRLAPDPQVNGRIRVDPREGKECQTHFRALQTHRGLTLVEAHPTTGRQHQIRVHLLASGHPIFGDALYGPAAASPPRQPPPMALRAVELSFRDPFNQHPIRILARSDNWLKQFGFPPQDNPGQPTPRQAVEKPEPT
jgi:RluA family pseudouridine synthase